MLELNYLERLAGEQREHATIQLHLFCATCGYDLYNLPRKGKCPECGSLYDTTQRFERGIYHFGENEAPIGHFVSIAVTAFAGAWLIAMAILSSSPLTSVFALPFLAVAVFMVTQSYSQLIAYWRDMRTQRRIRRNFRAD